MPPEILKYLEDIRFALSRIDYHLRNIHSFTEFQNDWTVYDAVERRLAIIGEAVWQIDKLDPNFILTSKKKIIGLRHILTHDYDLISPPIIWKIIEQNLEVLKNEIGKYLDEQ
jgi:uncharacterized protein with HEPN domain